MGRATPYFSSRRALGARGGFLPAVRPEARGGFPPSVPSRRLLQLARRLQQTPPSPPLPRRGALGSAHDACCPIAAPLGAVRGPPRSSRSPGGPCAASLPRRGALGSRARPRSHVAAPWGAARDPPLPRRGALGSRARPPHPLPRRVALGSRAPSPESPPNRPFPPSHSASFRVWGVASVGVAPMGVLAVCSVPCSSSSSVSHCCSCR
ncbi:unnamed protein product [Closterium sp. Yama58-4]|nr:unnamed protein product [Closterium sp. Yama58-4]